MGVRRNCYALDVDDDECIFVIVIEQWGGNTLCPTE